MRNITFCNFGREGEKTKEFSQMTEEEKAYMGREIFIGVLEELGYVVEERKNSSQNQRGADRKD